MRPIKVNLCLLVGLFSLLVVGVGVAQVTEGSVQRPPLPPKPTPVTELFRKLLVSTPGELEALLAERTPESRKVLLKKLEEYRALPSVQRNLKLSALDMRGYLTVLIPMEKGVRAEWVAGVPENDRAGVEARLLAWERLSPILQQQLIAQRRAAVLLSQLQIQPEHVGSSGTSVPTGSLMPPIQQFPPIPQIEKAISSWRALSELRRERVAERMMEVPKSPFEDLSFEERERCLLSFKRYARLSKEERKRFLYNAERWRKMSAQDRRVLRSLVVPVPPPLPPVRGIPPLPTR